MKGTYLGEFEELVLLVACILKDKAYAVSILKDLIKQSERKINISAVHSALYRLEEKGFLKSEVRGATTERGGRRKRFFTLTIGGKTALSQSKELRNRLWDLIPDFSV